MKEIPSHLGYDYIQRLLASHGYATVSVRVNGINAQDWALDDGGAGARAQIVRRHLDHWVQLAAGHQVDLSRVVLVGHSRGGEGVSRASLRIPTSAPYTIAGQVLIAPTDFGTQTAPYVPTVTMLPYCDGDVIDLQGQRFTDTARDLTTDDTSLKSSVMVMGANHNFFNTEWTPGVAAAPAWDDWFGPKDAACGTATPARLTAAEQRRVGQAYVAGAVRLFTRDAEEFLPMYDGSATKVASTGDAVVLSHAIGGGRNLRRPGIGTGLTLPDGAETQFCRGLTDSPGTAPDLRTSGREQLPDTTLAGYLGERAQPPGLRDELDRGRSARRDGLRLPARPVGRSAAGPAHDRGPADRRRTGARAAHRRRRRPGRGDAPQCRSAAGPADRTRAFQALGAHPPGRPVRGLGGGSHQDQQRRADRRQRPRAGVGARRGGGAVRARAGPRTSGCPWSAWTT